MPKTKKEKTEKLNMASRPPVVTIMGHVDHGKTTLLDAIRQTNVVAHEAGGITQNITAYQVEILKESKSRESEANRGIPHEARDDLAENRKITFIDTPGHAAFSQMRSRGAKVADIVVLVVAADDGVMPQTKEAIKFIQEAAIPIIVAINKIDLPGANIEKVKKQLSKENVLVEGYGGDVVVVPVSAKCKTGLDDLLEMILLVTEMQDLKTCLDCLPTGVVIESHLDKRSGPTCTIVVKDGIFKIGQEVFIEGIKSKIRSLFTEGRKLNEAHPSQPVEISGLSKVPDVGAIVDTLAADLTIPEVAIEQPEEELAIKPAWQLQLTQEKPQGRIILKTDVSGSTEAILANLPPGIKVDRRQTGDINQSDILLARSVKALVIGFNVNLSKEVQQLANLEKVPVKIYHVIYELLDDLEQLVEDLKSPEITEEITGRCQIIAQFGEGAKRIAGCKVEVGSFVKGANIRLLRNDKEIGKAKIKTLKRLKEDVVKVTEGEEFGLVLDPQLDFILSDVIESVRIKK